LNQTYTFVLPKPCSNLTLVSSEPSREKARLDAEKAAADKAAADKAAAEKAAAERARLEAERRERERAEAERLPARKRPPRRPLPSAPPPDKAAADKAEADRLAAEKDAKIDWFVSGSSARSAGRARWRARPPLAPWSTRACARRCLA